MFNVTMYSFTKKENSTARPSGSGTTYNCILRRGSSAINPTIELNVGAAGNPTGNNYAYIPAFNRFYFIGDWQFEDGIWTAAMRCDVLATYKIKIGAASLYILRASAASDGRIVDTMYPVKTGCTFNRTTQTTPWTLSDGLFIVGVVNNNPTIGGLCYYAMTTGQFSSALNALLSDPDALMQTNGFDSGDASFALQKSIADPIQHIKSVVYIPYGSITVGSLVTFKLGAMNIGFGLTPATITLDNAKIEVSRTFTLPAHPQAASRGVYMNAAPNTIRTLTFAPFGQIELDTSVTANASSIECIVDVDLPTGLGILNVECNGIRLNRIEAQVGVPVQISQITRNYIGGATSILSAITGAASAAVGIAAAPVTAGATAGMALGGISGAASNIGSAIKALSPRSETVGSGGSYAQLTRVPMVESQFFEAVADDNAHNGRPYCQMATPASLGGYMLVQDGDVPIDGTSEESARVRAYLEGGFYYE